MLAQLRHPFALVRLCTSSALRLGQTFPMRKLRIRPPRVGIIWSDVACLALIIDSGNGRACR